MAVFKCKMCGASFEFDKDISIGVCDYCGSHQTLPNCNDPVISNLLNRATTMRLSGNFDYAAELYEKVIEINSNEIEAYWGIVLCKYGVSYFFNESTKTSTPICSRTSYESIQGDADYLTVLQNANEDQKKLYINEAQQIDNLQKEILSVCKNEIPYEVFICAKEEENGKRTPDSVIADELYYKLDEKGFKVFYPAITLKDKQKSEYEPYVFSALNSAQIMLVVGTRIEFFDDPWLKNEWYRFLKLLASDRKKVLIPCYKDMEKVELPDEFLHLQIQNINDIGFTTEIVNGVNRIISKNAEDDLSQEQTETNDIVLLSRQAYNKLEMKDWLAADSCAENILNIDPESAEAYFIKMMISFKFSALDDIQSSDDFISESKMYKRFFRFFEKEKRCGSSDHLSEIFEKAYIVLEHDFLSAKTIPQYQSLISSFTILTGYKHSDSLIKKCTEKIELIEKYGSEQEVSKQICILKEKQALLKNNKTTIRLCKNLLIGNIILYFSAITIFLIRHYGNIEKLSHRFLLFSSNIGTFCFFTIFFFWFMKILKTIPIIQNTKWGDVFSQAFVKTLYFSLLFYPTFIIFYINYKSDIKNAIETTGVNITGFFSLKQNDKYINEMDEKLILLESIYRELK